MSMNETPVSERIRIGIFGRRNAGKSSLINAIAAQDVAVVSDIPGTTTDAVHRTMELLPLGPVVLTDTPGIDEEEDVLGQKRVERTAREIRRTDLAVIVLDAQYAWNGRGVIFAKEEEALINDLKEAKIPTVLVMNKSDHIDGLSEGGADSPFGTVLFVSALTGAGIEELKAGIAAKGKAKEKERTILDGIVKAGDRVVLVIPIDASAPKGRIILPQQMVLRELLETGAVTLAVKETELEETLKTLKELPDLVITDSQVFGKVAQALPADLPLTSFSILMARYRGVLSDQISGLSVIPDLQDGDTVLIAEGCTHHRQCEDIGTVKIPNALRKMTGKELKIETTSGGTFPDRFDGISLILHCGGCMLNDQEMVARAAVAKEAGMPMVNYGIFLAFANGILQRSLAPLPEFRYNSPV